MAIITLIVTALTVMGVLAGEKASRYEAAAKARGLTTRGTDVQNAEYWQFLAVLAFILAGTLVLFCWEYAAVTYNLPYWLKAGSLALNIIIVIGGGQFALWRRRSIMNPQPPNDKTAE
jgi:hypothetical protein